MAAGDTGAHEDGDVSERPSGGGRVPRRSRGGNRRFLTDVIVELGLASRTAVDEALEVARNSGTAPERLLLESGALTQDGLARALAERYGLQHLDLTSFQVDMQAANLISTPVARRHSALPVGFADEHTLLVAMADPSNVLAIDDMAIMTGYDVRVAVAPPEDIAALISKLNRLEDVVEGQVDEDADGDGDGAEVVALHDGSEDAPVVKLVNQLVAQAVERGASDLHLAAEGKEIRVRFRIDGVLQDITTVPRKMAGGVVSRIKIMADLDIAERRMPQDGRIGLTIDGKHVDLRVVTLPSVNGEGVVMRILDKSNVMFELDKLGMAAPERERFERACRETHGAILVTGPTGSGKSTTLYAALALLNTPETQHHHGRGPRRVRSRRHHPATGGAEGRPHLRGRPEGHGPRRPRRDHGGGDPRQRDRKIAVESALTGHLVLSTLHTNDAPSTITRLVEMGVEPFLVASALDCVVAQRLARMLCRHCKQRTIISPRRCGRTASAAASSWRRTRRSGAPAAAAAATKAGSPSMR